ncbi:uncharacterized protein METZ01_LOCUS444433, partial [marine metagenome]
MLTDVLDLAHTVTVDQLRDETVLAGTFTTWCSALCRATSVSHDRHPNTLSRVRRTAASEVTPMPGTNPASLASATAAKPA